VWRNIGQCSEILGDYHAAKEAFRKCVEAAPPNSVDECRGYFGVGAQLFRLGQPDAALHWWELGLEKRCDSADAHYQRSQILLALGRYEEGWREFEYRKQLRGYSDGIAARGGLPNLPEWDGKTRYAKVLCVMSQGAGDVIQFSRYMGWVYEATGVMPAFAVGEPLDRFVGWGDRPQVSDYSAFCHADSLPLLLRRPEPTPPNFYAPWRRPENPKPRIGICWKGSDKHLNDKDRSSPADPRPMLQSEKWELVSLQVGEGFAPKDYQETADLMRTLDAVVTVDTSVVHVAGTLGVPTVCIPPACPEWRWGIKGEATDWYPSVTLVRRREVYDWPEAWARAKAKLEEVTR
jgi:hypothetical protein